MKFTFGIITDGSTGVPPGAGFKSARERTKDIVAAIKGLGVPDAQIVVVGGPPVPGTEHVPFDESAKKAWITRKKNLVTAAARHENIVYMHDYVRPDKGWYKGFLGFGNDFKACMTPIKREGDGARYRDWTLSPEFAYHVMDAPVLGDKHEYMLPYGETELSKWQYFSGAYWVAKKKVMEEFPLDEGRAWGQGEDIIWSTGVRNKYGLQLNPHSVVYVMKPKHPVFHVMRPETLAKLKKKLLGRQ